MKRSAARIMCFCMILIFVLNYTNKVFKVKYSDGIYGLTKFYELNSDTVDVLILGSSHAFEDFNTGILWNEYGMASFILGGSVQPMWNTYYYLKEALKTQTPQLILLEGYMVVGYSEFLGGSSEIIKNTYGLKWSKDKAEAIRISAPEERWDEFLFEYTQYHTRYTKLSKSDFISNQGNPLYVDWKGFGCNMVTTPLEVEDVTEVVEKSQLHEKTEKYYRMIIELAKENNIPMLIVISPYAGINVDEQAKYNAAKEIADEYNVPFINYNLLIDDIGMDFSTDVADTAHLNYRGNQKYSYAVGAYIKENFRISDHRGDIRYQTWQNNADYISCMIENQLLLETVESDVIVEKIMNPNYCLIVSIDGNYLPNDDLNGPMSRLFRLIGIMVDSGGNGIYYRDSGNGAAWNIIAEGGEQYLRLDSHDVCMKRYSDESNEVYTNRVVVDNVEYKKVTNGVNVVVYDKITQSVIDSFGLNADDGYRVVR